MTLTQLNQLDKPALKAALSQCCGAASWVEKMCALFPVASEAILFAEAGRIWNECTEADWREAFTHHPKIGDVQALREKFAATRQWAAGEQSGVQHTTQQVLEDLAQGNKAYEEKFGYIFIVYATGKPAEEMLHRLHERLPNPPQKEIKIAMEEQNKITQIRLRKLLAS